MENNKDTNLIDSRAFIAPRAILEMYQKVSFPSFKIWASILSDLTQKKFSENDQYLPLSVIWQTLDGRLSHRRLEKHLDELQTTLIKKDEFITQTREREINSFTMLGPTTITVNSANDVTSLKYRVVKELISILKDDVNKEKFVIEMKTFISLKGIGGEHAKNLVLFCTPYVDIGYTAWITVEQLKNFMGLEGMYQEYKVFNRDVIKKAIKTIASNPYISFDITDVETQRNRQNITNIRFKLIERKSIATLLTENIGDDRSPLSPDKLRNMLLTYWHEKSRDNSISYAPEILEKLLIQFRLVDKYVSQVLDLEAYQNNPIQETFRIFNLATAVTQLWLDGHLDKEDSKIYNYAFKIFTNPKERQIDALTQKFLIGAEVKLNNNKVDKNLEQEALQHQLYSIDKLVKNLAKYERLRFEKAITTFTEDELKSFDQEFRSKSKAKMFGTWAFKALEKCEDQTRPLAEVLTRRTLALYKINVTNKAVSLGKLVEKSTDDLLYLFPELKRYMSALNLSPTMPYITLETTLSDLKNSK